MLTPFAQSVLSEADRLTDACPPLWLAATASARGVRLPQPGERYSWCELGCGSGLGAVINAAANPLARFIAIDADRRRIAEGRRLAEAAAINNVVFLCAPLASLALADCARGPLHDVIVFDGEAITDHAAAAAIERCAARWLKPGGALIDLSDPVEFADSSVRLLASEPALPEPCPVTRERCQRLNRLICEQALEGSGHAHLAAPALGSALPADLLQMAALKVLLECPGVEGDLLQEMVRIVLEQAGRPLAEGLERRLECFERLVLPHWRRLGLLPASDRNPAGS